MASTHDSLSKASQPTISLSERGSTLLIYPNLGASIQRWTVDKMDVIDGCFGKKAESNYYQKMYSSAILFPFPNRLKEGHYRFKNREYRFPVNFPMHQCAIHGMLYNAAFKVLELRSNSVKLEYVHPGNDAFPFEFKFIASYILEARGLELQFSVHNMGKEEFPFGIGWHPYFKISEKGKNTLHTITKKVFLTDENLIPTKSEAKTMTNFNLNSLQLDDAFELASDLVTLETANYTLSMTLPKKSYLQIFTPEDLAMVAIEPMSCIADAFNNKIGLKLLQPKDVFDWKIKLKISV